MRTWLSKYLELGNKRLFFSFFSCKFADKFLLINSDVVYKKGSWYPCSYFHISLCQPSLLSKLRQYLKVGFQGFQAPWGYCSFLTWEPMLVYEDWFTQRRFLTWEPLLVLWGLIHTAQIPDVRAHVGAMGTDGHSADSWRVSLCWRYEDRSTQRRFLTWELMLALWGLIHTA